MNSTLYRSASEEEDKPWREIRDEIFWMHSECTPLSIHILNRHKAFACIRPGSLSCHSLVIRPLHVRVCVRVCVCACRRKKNKPPLIHVFPPSLTITWKRRGPKPGSTINQISPSRKNVPSSILWNCCVSCHKGIRRGKMNRENCCKKKSYESDFTNANQGIVEMEKRKTW